MSERRRTNNQCAIVVGAGSRTGIGGAICARFAKEGLHVYAVGRNAQKLESLATSMTDIAVAGLTTVSADITRPVEVEALFERISGDGLVPSAVVFNAAELNVPTPFMDMTPEFVYRMWQVCCFGGFLVGQEAARQMLPLGSGTVIFTGASASLRGRAKFGGFAAAKSGLRAIAQSMARELGPQGIHVAHVIVDGAVDGDRIREIAGGIGKAYLESRGEDGALNPEAVADVYWQLHAQHRSAWTHELDLRPFREEF